MIYWPTLKKKSQLEKNCYLEILWLRVRNTMFDLEILFYPFYGFWQHQSSAVTHDIKTSNESHYLDFCLMKAWHLLIRYEYRSLSIFSTWKFKCQYLDQSSSTWSNKNMLTVSDFLSASCILCSVLLGKTY